jgi:hypothetical protein
MKNAKLTPEGSDIRERTFDFAIRIVRLCRYLDRKPGSARETLYWLRLVGATETIDAARIQPLQSEAEQLRNILGAIVVSAKQNLVKRAASGTT